MNALDVVDAAVADRVVVVGSLPPHGRDLDLVLRAGERDAVVRALAEAGFDHRGTSWARFRPGAPPELVDLAPLPLPRSATDALLAEAVPLPGCAHVCRPVPAHALLLLARAVARDGTLSERRRARAEAAVAEDPDAWAAARALAPAWRLGAEVELLDGALRGQPLPRPTGVRVRGRLHRVRHGGVVAISGMDGAGKSTQAERLRETLAAIGVDAVVSWNRLAHDRWLEALARPVKRVLRRGHRGSGAPGGSGEVTAYRDELRSAWVVVVALANAVAHLRSVLPHRAAGRVVICDRYVLDSVVHLRESYPPGTGRRLAAALVRLLSPTPRCALLLDVPAPVLVARKPTRLAPELVATRAERYREESARLGVLRLDGEREADELAAEIARAVWLAL